MIKKLNEQKAPILGKVVFWALEDVSITRSELEKLFEKHGLDKRFMPPVISGRKAFNRVLRDFEKKEKQKLVRKIDETGDFIIYGIVDEEVDKENIDLDYELVDAVIFDKVNEHIYLKLRRMDSDKINEHFSYFKANYTADDIRKMITDCLLNGCNAFLLRRHGGVYFVPKDKIDTLEKLKKVVEEIGSSEFYCLDIYDAEETRRTAIKLFKDEFVQELEENSQKLIELLQKDKPRADSIKSALEKFNHSKEKLEVFKQLLEFTMEDIEKKIKETEEKVRKLLLGELFTEQ
ncbi:MAG TPA: hypothetical protein ENF94_00045 [Candidatus Woesearchaeota archaeon]|nr:hypothetical protein [Candidatus Woesearchaeota archaeon]